MDLDHLHALVTAARDEGDDGPAYDALVAYMIDLSIPAIVHAGVACETPLARALRVGIEADPTPGVVLVSAAEAEREMLHTARHGESEIAIRSLKAALGEALDGWEGLIAEGVAPSGVRIDMDADRIDELRKLVR